MVTATNLGFSRIGQNRQLKRLVEAFWAGKLDEQTLVNNAKTLRAEHWQLQAKELGPQAHIPSNDFSFYDHVLDHSAMFGAIPKRYAHLKDLEAYFAMGRGLQKPEEGVDVPAMEMKKWFDTNYHYVVPEFELGQNFSLTSTKPISEYLEAKALGIQTRPVLLGPVSYLLLGKAAKGESFEPITLLERIIPVYEQLVDGLAKAGAEWIQFDEPVLVFDQPPSLKTAYETAYSRIANAAPSLKILVATYFGHLDTNIEFLVNLPIHGIHFDLIRAPDQLSVVLTKVPSHIFVSLGVINGRNVWRADLAATIAIVRNAVDILGSNRVLVAPSCSLLHVPHSLEAEKKMDKEILNWLAFGVEKLQEIAIIVKAVRDGDDAVKEELEANRQLVESRKVSSVIHNPEVKHELEAITPDMLRRQSPFSVREKKQHEKLNLPLFTTHTVGSFPQTKHVRVARQMAKKGKISFQEYKEFISKEIASCVRFQEEVGIDILVHGEFERNDMVEYFGESLKGYVFSENGWVQSYGSRCVKPPIIYGDVSRPVPMTVEWSKYAQSLTNKPVKGMLTGPVTMLQWSFVREDQPRKDTTFQLALAIRKEVVDLEQAGIHVIQIDEPAIREGLPLRGSEWESYLSWALDAFLLATTGVDDTTQIHTHMCYSDFNDIFTSIQKMDADVITIENSKSDLKLLDAFARYSYTNGIGPGLYDIHSPRIPSVNEMEERAKAILKYIPSHLLYLNPDCGLKTRGWYEVKEALKNLVEVARDLRALV